MSDYLLRVLSDKANVIGLACRTTELVNLACRLHGTTPTASAALGRALTGGLLLGALAKPGLRVGLKFEGNGPLKKILVEADSEGNVRGFVGVPNVDVMVKDGKLHVSGVLGKEGHLTVFKDVGLDKPYQGIVKLRTGEIAEDIAYYLAESEQIPSAVGLGVYVETDGRVSAAGGFLVQSLPPSEEATLDRLIDNIGRVRSVTDVLRDGKAPEDLLGLIFEGIPYKILEKKGLSFRCNCSRDRIEEVLISLGCTELRRLAEEKGEAEVTCEFCRAAYRFDRTDLEQLIRDIECGGTPDAPVPPK
ncbi:MAG: Hsp33 family molecular chaperone HslO [Syntrophaceae bacterium]|nr:Hsp33 family molecular chaperone HslO [Syntrophaceae bacterium]